jgi:hypothetical protein
MARLDDRAQGGNREFRRPHEDDSHSGRLPSGAGSVKTDRRLLGALAGPNLGNNILDTVMPLM